MIFNSRRDANQSELPSITVGEVDGKPVVISLPPAKNPKVPSTLYFTLPKAGTLMLTNLIKNLAPIVGSKLYYPIGELFKLGILDGQAPASTGSLFLPRGYCYGLPNLPGEFEIPILGQVKTVLLVRDPRDLAVSLYFSSRFSHPTPGSLDGKPGVLPHRSKVENMELDFFAGRAAMNYYTNRFRKYAELANLPGVKVFRYEDIIYDKLQWAGEICDHFEWNIPRRNLESAVAQIDVFPDKERPNDHVRQVHPGNYKSKLQPETIRHIEQHLAEEMAFFGYKPDEDLA